MRADPPGRTRLLRAECRAGNLFYALATVRRRATAYGFSPATGTTLGNCEDRLRMGRAASTTGVMGRVPEQHDASLDLVPVGSDP